MEPSDAILRLIENTNDKDGDRARYAVMLPCTSENFAEFIIGLLGENQIIESRVPGLFAIGRQDVDNITDILDQRIRQQNDLSKLSWSLTVSYDNDTTVKHNSLTEFTKYAEINEHIAISFTIRMTYLIKFRERNTFEKQSVDVTFESGYEKRDFSEAFPSDPRRQPFCGFTIRIEHTLRSWGVDADSLLQKGRPSRRTATSLPVGFFVASLLARTVEP